MKKKQVFDYQKIRKLDCYQHNFIYTINLAYYDIWIRKICIKLNVDESTIFF